MTNKQLNLDSSLYSYILANSLREHPVLEQLRAYTAQLPSARMQVSPEQGQFLAWLVGLLGAKRTIDVGVFTGYSALAVALALPDDGVVFACDRDQAITRVAQEYWSKADVHHKIDLKVAPALDTLDQLIADGQGETFDFVFIDADKRNYHNYYELSLKLIRKGGLIAIDNVLWSGRVADGEIQDPKTQSIRDFNRFVHGDQRVDLTLVPIADGLTLVRKL
jgi:predicted O-methyltransferase YrrM